MSSNPYFQWYNQTNEQNFIDDLIVESIKNHAHDVYYLPRTGIGEDGVLGEYAIAKFNTACAVEMYVKTVDGFGGEGELVSKFGFEVKNQIVLTISVRSFQQFIRPFFEMQRPREGDCVWIPMLGVVYQITFVNKSAIFYTLGKLNTYELTMELLDYSNEQFNTGIEEIDNKYKPFENMSSNTYSLESYDRQADNQSIQVSANNVLDFTELDPFEIGQF